MNTKHIFVPALDVGEILPFTVREKKAVQETIAEQERARKELEKFITQLQREFKEPIWYMGMDIIAGKSYERFIFEKGGFFEVMVESPVALNAHFVHEQRAKQFSNALKNTLRKLMPATPLTEMFLSSIEVQTENDDSLTVEKWTKMKKIRKA
ncbi:hypothetical protein HY605_04465 [Candidatus Peregrinibacteria bacterium]|nr:hypothetical protein [Candidatus Peregrinibacteria bacterium]